MTADNMEPYQSNKQLVEDVAQRADDHRVLARGPGGRPVVAARAGGDEGPPIMLTAGAHATEQAGVVAAVELLDRLETDREIHVIPTRDPLGVDGYAAALEEALGTAASFLDYDELADLLRLEGTVLVDDGDAVVGLIGDYGFATSRPPEGESSSHYLSNLLSNLEGTDEMEPLRGRRVFLVPGHPNVTGTGDFERLYTRVITPGGENLHLNRFIGSSWTPPESAAVRELADDVEPGLFVDLHEYAGDGYWVSARPKADENERQRELDIGRAMIERVGDAGGYRLPLAEFMADKPDHFSEVVQGLWDLDYQVRGEGFNATDYVAEHHGLAFTNETGMYRPFEERVEMAVRSVREAVDTFDATS